MMSTNDDDSLVYTVEEAKRALKIGKTTLYKMIEAGEIVSRKAQGRTLIPKASVMAWLRGEAA